MALHSFDGKIKGGDILKNMPQFSNFSIVKYGLHTMWITGTNYEEVIIDYDEFPMDAVYSPIGFVSWSNSGSSSEVTQLPVLRWNEGTGHLTESLYLRIEQDVTGGRLILKYQGTASADKTAFVYWALSKNNEVVI
jgi:hypothetical protein